MRLRKFTMGSPQAQHQTGRVGGVTGIAVALACVNCTKASLRRALWCSTPKLRARCKPLNQPFKRTCAKSRSNEGFYRNLQQ
jgi:hypothetical protein